MIDIEYCNACTEVLEILKYIPKEDYDKIPRKKIEVLEMDKNIDYNFRYDVNKTLNEQNVSKKARLILAIFYRDYWATERQKLMILSKEKYDMNKLEQEKRDKYNPDNLFKNNSIEKKERIINNEIHQTEMIEYKKENLLNKIINKFKFILLKFKQN